jgi:tRNA splicing ligase
MSPPRNELSRNESFRRFEGRLILGFSRSPDVPFDVFDNLHQLTQQAVIDRLARFQSFDVGTKLGYASLNAIANALFVAFHGRAFRS